MWLRKNSITGCTWRSPILVSLPSPRVLPFRSSLFILVLPHPFIDSLCKCRGVCECLCCVCVFEARGGQESLDNVCV